MTSRALFAVVAIASASAFAQNISGTFTANYVSTSEYGQPTTHVELKLICGLSCPTSAPKMTYGVGGLVEADFAADATQHPGDVSYSFATGVHDTGVSTMDSTNFPPGANFFLKAKSANCVCGNGALQSGFIDVTSNTVSIPPFVKPPFTVPYTLGVNPLPSFSVTAAPRGAESVTVTAKGAGVDLTKTYTATEWMGTSSSSSTGKFIEVTPTQAGTVTVTAQVTGTPVSTITFDVVAGSSGGGTGGGSGSSGTGGSSTSQSGGCSAVDGGFPWAALAGLGLLLRRR